MKRVLISLLTIIAIISAYLNTYKTDGIVAAQANITCDDPNFTPYTTFKYFDNSGQSVFGIDPVSNDPEIFKYIDANQALNPSSGTVSADNGTHSAFCCPAGEDLWYQTPNTGRISLPGSVSQSFVCCPSPRAGNENIVATDGQCASRFAVGNKVVDEERPWSNVGIAEANAGAAVGGLAQCDEDVKNSGKKCPNECPRVEEWFGSDLQAVICQRPTNNPLSDPNLAANTPQVLTAYGNACVPQLASCDPNLFPGKRNLLEAVRSGDINSSVGWSMDQSTVLGDLRREFGTNLNNICINENITAIIPIKLDWLRGADPGSYIYHASNGETILRGCTNGLVPSTAPDAGAGDVVLFNSGWSITGCCLPDQQFVTPTTRASITGSEYQRQGRCCNLNGSRPGDPNFPYQTDGTTCFNEQGGPLGLADTNLSNIEGIDFGLGSGQYATDNSQTALLCPPTSDCVITGKNGNRAVVADPADLVNNQQLACYRCYENGEAIQVDVSAKLLLTCDNGNLKENPLINNSVASTLAYLREADVTGEENADALESCLNRGGLYVAIGCIDPTPLGVITGLIRIAFGIMGGVSLIQLIVAGIAYQSGDEAKIQEAREKVISTITGVALLVFSVLILRIIGINVLDVVPVGSF